MTDNEIIKATDILDKFDFFYGQRAGRELWNEKPVDIQNKDIESFSNDVAFLKDFINRQKAEIENLRTQLLIRNSVEVRKIKIPKGEPYGHKDPVGEPGTPGPCGFAENCNHVREGKSRSNQRVCGEVESDSYMRFRVEHVEYYDKPSIEKMVLFIDDNDIDNLVKEMG